MYNGTLDVCWSGLLEICADVKEPAIRIKKFKKKPPEWDLEEWVSEGIHFPPVVRIFTKFEYFKMAESNVLLSSSYISCNVPSQ